MRPAAWSSAAILLTVFGHLLVEETNAQVPGWWHAQNVHGRAQYTSAFPTAQDYAVTNLGQTKWMATRAYSQLVSSDIQFPNLSLAPSLYTDTLTTIGPTSVDFAGLNLGQLKNVRSLLYDAAFIPIPAPPGGSVASDYSLANNGQLKSVFNFDIGTDWTLRTLGDITIAPELPPNAFYEDLTNYPNESRRQAQAREREYKLVVGISGLSTLPANGFNFQDFNNGGRRTVITTDNWGEKLNLIVRSVLSSHLGDGDWQVPPMTIVGPNNGTPTYGPYILEDVDREINLDVYFDDGALNLYRQNGSARLRQRFSGANRFMDRMRYYVTGHSLSLTDGHAHSRLEYQIKLDETEIPVPDFANVGDGYSEVTQTRLFLFGNAALSIPPFYRGRTDLFTKLMPGYQAGAVVWPPPDTSFASQPVSLVGRALYRALKSAHGTYTSGDQLLRAIPSAVIVGQRHRQHLLSTNGTAPNGGNNSQQLLIITTDITYVYDPATFFTFMRTSLADDDLPAAAFASAEIEVQVEDQIWTRHVDNKRLGDGSYPPDALADYARLQADMRKTRDIIQAGVTAAIPSNPGLVGINGGIVSKYRQAINALGRTDDNLVYLAGRVLPKLATMSIEGGNSVTVGVNQEATVIPVGFDQTANRIFPNGGWQTVVAPGGATLQITPVESVDLTALHGRTRVEAVKIKGLSAGTAAVTITDPAAGPGSPSVVLNVTVN